MNAILAFLGSKRMIALLFGLAGTVLGLFASEGVKWWLNRPIPKIELASPVFDGFEPPHTKIRRPFELRMQTTPFYSDPRVLSFLAGDTITLANLVDMISGLGGQTEFQVNLKLGLTPSAPRIVIGPRISPRNWARKATVSSPWALVSSGSRRKSRLGCRRTGLTLTAADGRDPSLTVPRLLDGRLGPRGVGAADQRGEQARLVEEDQVGLPILGLLDDPGQFLTPSVGGSSRRCAA